MKKLIGIMLLSVLVFSGFSFKETVSSSLAYLRRPIDLAVDTAVRAMNASASIVNNSARASVDAATTLYSDVTAR